MNHPSDAARRPLESVSPDGESFAIPTADELRQQAAAIAEEARAVPGRQVVVVQGLGFVGAAVAAVVASAVDERGEPRYFVIGVDLPTPAGYWKVAKTRQGVPSLSSPDPHLGLMTRRAVLEQGNLRATASSDVYALADVIVVDIPLDVESTTVRRPGEIGVRVEAFEAAMRTVGRLMREDALVLIETTVPVGTTAKLALPALQDERAKRGITRPVLLAHCYERVMPGPRYVESIRSFWRTFAGVDAASSARARQFLDSVIDTKAFPLAELGSTTASELGKLLENSYRAANIAFIHEWALAAEDLGVNLFEVIDSVRVRRGTHDNIRQPGFGVGGYCLTKDSLLAQWSISTLFGSEVSLSVTLEALRINYDMPLHSLRLLGTLLGGDLRGKRVVVAGISYLPELADTRNSPSEVLIDHLLAAGAEVVAHDPCVRVWTERPEIAVHQDLAACMAGAHGVVLAVPHKGYLGVSGDEWVALTAPGTGVVDAQNILTDAKAATLHAAGRRLRGVGKGHWNAQGYHQ